MGCCCCAVGLASCATRAGGAETSKVKSSSLPAVIFRLQFEASITFKKRRARGTNESLSKGPIRLNRRNKLDAILKDCVGGFGVVWLRLQRNQLMSNGKQGQLQPGGNPSFVEDIRQVALNGLFADTELLGDIAIAATLYDAAHDFQLPRRQSIGLALGYGSLLHELVQGANQVDHALAANPVISRRNRADGGREMVSQCILEDDTAGANLQRFNNLLGGDGAGQQQNLYRRRTAHDGAHRLQAGQTRHLQIKQEDIRQQLERCCNRFIAIRSFAQHFKAAVALEHVFYANAYDRMVVGNDDTDLVQAVVAGFRRCGNCRSGHGGPVFRLDFLPKAYAPTRYMH